MIGKNQTAAAIAEWVGHVVPALQTCPLHHQNPENNPTPTRAPRSHPPIWDISQVLESDTKPQRHEVRPVRLSLRQTELSSSQGKPWKRAPERWKGRHTNPWFDHTWNIRPVWDPHTRWKDITRIEDVHRRGAHFVIKKKKNFFIKRPTVLTTCFAFWTDRVLNSNESQRAWPCFTKSQLARSWWQSWHSNSWPEAEENTTDVIDKWPQHCTPHPFHAYAKFGWSNVP